MGKRHWDLPPLNTLLKRKFPMAMFQASLECPAGHPFFITANIYADYDARQTGDLFINDRSRGERAERAMERVASEVPTVVCQSDLAHGLRGQRGTWQ